MEAYRFQFHVLETDPVTMHQFASENISLFQKTSEVSAGKGIVATPVMARCSAEISCAVRLIGRCTHESNHARCESVRMGDCNTCSETRLRKRTLRY